MRKPHRSRWPNQNWKWTRRRWRNFCPVGMPAVILRGRFCCYLFNLLRSKSCMPDYMPFRRQSLEINQTIFAKRSGFPAIITHFDFSTSSFSEIPFIGRKRVDTVNGLIFFPQFLQPLFVFAPSPTIKLNDNKNADDYRNKSSSNSCADAVFLGNGQAYGGRDGNDEDNSQQFN